MISALILCRGAAGGLAETLSSLTPAAVEGLVREALVIGAHGDAAAAEIIDEAGARSFDGSLKDAVAQIRQPWLLILPAGSRLQIGWERAALGHIRHRPEARGWFQLNYAHDGLAARLGEGLANLGALWLGAPRAEQGLLVATRLWSPKAAGPARAMAARILAPWS